MLVPSQNGLAGSLSPSIWTTDLNSSQAKGRLFDIFEESEKPSSCQPSLADKRITLFTLQKASDLALGLVDTKLTSEIARTMLAKFQQTTSPTSGQISEICEIFVVLDLRSKKLLIERLLSLIMQNTINMELIFKELTKIFTLIRIQYEQQAIRKISENPKVDFLNVLLSIIEEDKFLTPDDYVRILNILTTKFKSTTPEIKSNKFAYLETVFSFLELIIFIKTQDVKLRNIYDTSRAIFEKFKDEDKNNLFLDYLSNYNQEALELISDDIVKPPSYFKQKLYVLRGFINICAPNSPNLSNLQAHDIYIKLKQAKNLSKTDWFISLMFLNYYIRNDPSLLNKLFEDIETNPKEVVRYIDFRQPFLTIGFVFLLMEFTNDQNLQEVVFKLLKIIEIDNKEKSSSNLFKIDNKSYAQQICQFISQYPHNKGKLRIEAVPASNDNSMLLEIALKKVVPWLEPIKDLKKQVEDEIQKNPFYLPVVEPENRPSALVNNGKQVIQHFLEGHNRILLLEGEIGVGKTTFVKRMAVELWNSAQSNFVPVVVSLAEFNRPNEIINQLARKYNFTKIKPPILWMFDGFEQLPPHQQKVNLFRLNDLYRPEWTSSKLIITCRSPYLIQDDYRVFWPNKNSSEGLVQYSMLPFQEWQTQVYLTCRLLNVRKLTAAEIPADSDVQIENAKYRLARLLSILQPLMNNPLILKIFFDFFPSLVSADVVPALLLDVIFCSLVERELTSSDKRVQEFNGLQYLEEFLNLATNIRNYYQKQSISSNAKICLDDLNSEAPYIEVTKNFCPIIKDIRLEEGKHYLLINEIMYQYFIHIIENSKHKDRVRKYLENRVFNYCNAHNEIDPVKLKNAITTMLNSQ